MAKTTLKIVNKFYAGAVRDDRAKVVGAHANIEEWDIFSNGDAIIPEQILSAETLPANTEIYAYDVGDDDTGYAYGRKTDATAGTVRLLSVATAGADNPGNFSTLFTSADTTNLATRVGDLKFFRTTEVSNPTSLYYIQGTGSSWYLSRYNIGAAAEQTWNGSAWAAGTANSNSQLTGLTGSFDRPTMKIIYGELFILHNRFIARVDKDGTFTAAAFTLPSEWQAIDIIPVGDSALILCRNKNRISNQTAGFWWDLTSSSQFDDSFFIPMGGPQWVTNQKEIIKIFCSINGIGKFYQLSGAFKGGIPIEIPNIYLTNVGTELTTRPISAPKMIGQKQGILYFGLLKTDKSGIYAMGQLDQDKPNALVLSKRFNTTAYTAHRPTALHIHGPNFFASYDDNGTETSMRCESNNSPTRSSNAVLETIYVDDDKPFQDKQLGGLLIGTKQLPASCALTTSIAADYTDSYTQVNRADGSIYNTTNLVGATMKTPGFANKKAFKAKIQATSSGTSYPTLQFIGFLMTTKDELVQ